MTMRLAVDIAANTVADITVDPHVGSTVDIKKSISVDITVGLVVACWTMP